MPKVAIVGTGWGARVQVPAFQEAGLTIVGIAGFHRNKTERVARELGVEPFPEWRSLVTSSEVELVTIVTPPSEHLEMATTALQAGKHVVSEKPTALNTREAEQLLAAAESHPGQIAIIDHELRFLPAWRAARERIGEIGALRYAEVRYASPGRGDRSREWNWWSDAARGGGVWGAVGSHFVDALRYFGFEIEAVQALLHTAITERPFGNERRRVTSDDYASIHLRLEGGAVADMMFSAVSSAPDEPTMMTFHGEEGAMRFVGEEFLLARRDSPFHRAAGGDMPQRPGNSSGGAFGTGTLLLGKAVHAALSGDRAALAPAATFQDGLAQQRVLDAARQSARTEGKWTSVAK